MRVSPSLRVSVISQEVHYQCIAEYAELISSIKQLFLSTVSALIVAAFLLFKLYSSRLSNYKFIIAIKSPFYCKMIRNFI